MSEEELLKKFGCNSLGSFIDSYLTCDVAYDLLRSQFKEIERLNNIIETTKIFVEKYNDKPFDIEVREMILKCLNDELKGSDKK